MIFLLYFSIYVSICWKNPIWKELILVVRTSRTCVLILPSIFSKFCSIRAESPLFFMISASSFLTSFFSVFSSYFIREAYCLINWCEFCSFSLSISALYLLKFILFFSSIYCISFSLTNYNPSLIYSCVASMIFLVYFFIQSFRALISSLTIYVRDFYCWRKSWLLGT